jgi:4-aminobutyrate aminotransferase-like enzyme
MQEEPPHDRPVEAHGLVKRYGATTALGGIDLDVPVGTVTAVLGPNGAGKTTAVRILTTLTDADEGRAVVAGFDVASQGNEVRRRIGLAAQDATVDPLLTGRENLVMLGELHQLAGRHPMIGDVRGRGLLLAAELVSDRATKTPVSAATVRSLVVALARRGVLVAGGGHVLRITPPLVITEDMARTGLALLDEALTEVEAA